MADFQLALFRLQELRRQRQLLTQLDAEIAELQADPDLSPADNAALAAVVQNSKAEIARLRAETLQAVLGVARAARGAGPQ